LGEQLGELAKLHKAGIRVIREVAFCKREAHKLIVVLRQKTEVRGMGTCYSVVHP
jgi:hypothetical protein